MRLPFAVIARPSAPLPLMATTVRMEVPVLSKSMFVPLRFHAGMKARFFDSRLSTVSHEPVGSSTPTVGP